MLIDTHAHITHDSLWTDLAGVVQRCEQSGVKGVVNVCLSQDDLERSEKLPHSGLGLAIAAGLHPTSIGATDQSAFFDQITKWALTGRLAAIGETGFDSFRAISSLDEQAVQLKRHLDLALRAQLPVIIHCRGPGAFSRLIKLLKLRIAEKRGDLPGVVHCFSEGPNELNELLELGWFVGFGGLMTYSSSQMVRESALRVPNDRFVLETDSPFLSPAPGRVKRNEPAQLQTIASFLAQLRNQSQETIKEIATRNTFQLFPLLRKWPPLTSPVAN